MGYILTFIAGGLIGVWTMCAMVQAGQADDREDMMLSRLISCAGCSHSDDSCRWCRLLDMPIDEDKYCCWAEEDKHDT